MTRIRFDGLAFASQPGRVPGTPWDCSAIGSARIDAVQGPKRRQPGLAGQACPVTFHTSKYGAKSKTRRMKLGRFPCTTPPHAMAHWSMSESRLCSWCSIWC